jgi:hypothetical protein
MVSIPPPALERALLPVRVESLHLEMSVGSITVVPFRQVLG